MRRPDNGHDFLVNFGCSSRRAGETGIPAKIHIIDHFQRGHIKLLRHAQTRDHGPGEFCCFLDIIGCAAGHFGKNEFFRSASGGEGCNLVEDLLSGHEKMLVFIHLHGVT